MAGRKEVSAFGYWERTSPIPPARKTLGLALILKGMRKLPLHKKRKFVLFFDLLIFPLTVFIQSRDRLVRYQYFISGLNFKIFRGSYLWVFYKVGALKN